MLCQGRPGCCESVSSGNLTSSRGPETSEGQSRSRGHQESGVWRLKDKRAAGTFEEVPSSWPDRGCGGKWWAIRWERYSCEIHLEECELTAKGEGRRGWVYTRDRCGHTCLNDTSGRRVWGSRWQVTRSLGDVQQFGHVCGWLWLRSGHEDADLGAEVFKGQQTFWCGSKDRDRFSGSNVSTGRGGDSIH